MPLQQAVPCLRTIARDVHIGHSAFHLAIGEQGTFCAGLQGRPDAESRVGLHTYRDQNQLTILFEASTT